MLGRDKGNGSYILGPHVPTPSPTHDIKILLKVLNIYFLANIFIFKIFRTVVYEGGSHLHCTPVNPRDPCALRKIRGLLKFFSSAGPTVQSRARGEACEKKGPTCDAKVKRGTNGKERWVYG